MNARLWRHGRWAVPLVVFVAALGAASARAAAEVEVGAALGFGGWVVPGVLIPLRLEVRAASALDGTLVVAVPSARRGGEPVRHVQPLRLAPGGRQQVSLDVVVHDPRRPLLVSIRDAGGERLRRTVPVGVARAVEGVVGALSRDAAGLEFLARSEGKRRPAYLGEADLPVRWQGYASLDLLILRDLDARAWLPAQRQALLEWMAQGGRLLVIAPQRIDPADASSLRVLLRPGRYGLGTIEVWNDDLFAPALRSRADLHARMLALLRQPARPHPGEAPGFASILPATRPLSGPAQLSLAAVSVLYILAVRVVLRRPGTTPGRWAALGVLILAASGILYLLASSARGAATSVGELSIAETLGPLPLARVTTYASLVAPYGGPFVLRLPEGAAVRALDDVPVTIRDGGREVRGAAPAGSLSFVAHQIVPLSVGARLSGAGTLVLERGGTPLRGAILYSQRQLYRLPAEPGGPLALDPARWEPVDRSGVLGSDMLGQALGLLFTQLDRVSTGTWLIGRISDDRLAVRVPGGTPGEAIRLVVTEVR